MRKVITLVSGGIEDIQPPNGSFQKEITISLKGISTKKHNEFIKVTQF